MQSFLFPVLCCTPLYLSRFCNHLVLGEKLTSHDTGIGWVIKLRPLKLSRLAFLTKKILVSKFSDQMHIAELIARDKEFFPKLISLFRSYEDSEYIVGLHTIFQLLRAIILLSNLSVFDRKFFRKHLMDVVGALEYDPEKPTTVKEHHRSLLETSIKEHIIFKENLPVKDKSVIIKLCQSYAAAYIKDVMKTLDEATIASLTFYAHAKDAETIHPYSHRISDDSKRDLVLFFCELWCFNESADNAQVSEFWWYIVDGETYNTIVAVMRDIISQNDERRLRRIVKNHLFRLVIEIFYDAGNRFRKVHGGVLKLLEYIATENVEVLVIYLWEMFSEKLEEFEQFKGIQSLKIKYNQSIANKRLGTMQMLQLTIEQKIP
ncbi:Serine/threonine-protein phosphatase 4 regulatory subunit 3 [Rhynchospora pubera]|uniref:Serine/threonine-protein phosphatase 4 regulatory subunit 3 n=1 Tax=Rhynchospora pubera TaxID=906938 RepID=A0AAV8GDM2_9POAL|nr:Serine/threonine-protein phosphatase 4 regulatory subunit 3 [Rhynchospora pubera]